MRIGRLMRTLTPRRARGRGRQHATYRVYVRPIGFTCDLRGPRAAQPHRRSHAMSIHAPSEPAQRCVLERGSVPDSSGTSGHVVVLSKTQFSSHIAARLPKLRYYSPRTIARLHDSTTTPDPQRGSGNPAGNPAVPEPISARVTTRPGKPSGYPRPCACSADEISVPASCGST